MTEITIPLKLELDFDEIERLVKRSVVEYFDFCHRTKQGFNNAERYMLARIIDGDIDDNTVDHAMVLAHMGFFDCEEAAKIVCGAWACELLTTADTDKESITRALDAFSAKYHELYASDPSKDVEDDDVTSVLAFIKSISSIRERL